MITKEQALTVDRFTHSTLKNADKSPLRVKRNGKTKTWKRKPDDFSIPVKYGLYGYSYITQDNAEEWNVAE